MSGQTYQRSSVWCNGQPACPSSVNEDGNLTCVRKKAAILGWVYGVIPRTDSGPAHTVDLCPDCTGQMEGLGARRVEL